MRDRTCATDNPPPSSLPGLEIAKLHAMRIDAQLDIPLTALDAPVAPNDEAPVLSDPPSQISTSDNLFADGDLGSANDLAIYEAMSIAELEANMGEWPPWKQIGEYILAGGGMLPPPLGTLFDAGSLTLSVASGDLLGVVIDLIGFIPGPGDWAKPGLLAAKHSLKNALGKFGKAIDGPLAKLWGETLDNAELKNLIVWLDKKDPSLGVLKQYKKLRAEVGVTDFRTLKELRGPAPKINGETMHLDHIVEQNQIRGSGFSARSVHSTNNTVYLPPEVNRRLNGDMARKNGYEAPRQEFRNQDVEFQQQWNTGYRMRWDALQSMGYNPADFLPALSRDQAREIFGHLGDANLINRVTASRTVYGN